MKSLIGLLILSLWMPMTYAQSDNDIVLKAPNATRGVDIMEAFARRQSERAFAKKELTPTDLSDLLWAANGINRPADGKRTAPSAMNKQDIDIYVFTSKGVYLYDAPRHALKWIVKGDHRKLVASGQDFVETAPVSLVYVSDVSRFGRGLTEQAKAMGAMDAGIVSQNVNLFCAGAGLATVPRATMNQEGLKKLLNLSATQLPLMNNPVGYPVR